MNHKHKTKQQLIAELEALQQRVAELEAAGSSSGESLEDREPGKVLRESEERYRSLVENIHLGITLMDRNYRIVMINRGHASMIGRNVEDCIGQECFRVFEKREAVCPHCPGARAMATGKPGDVEATAVRDDGSTYAARVQAFPVLGQDGAPDGFIEVVEDITERKQAEAALAESQAKYRHLVEATDTGYLILDEQGRVVDANAEYVRISGHNVLADILGHSVTEWTASHDTQRNAEAVERCLETGNTRHLEVDYIRADGTTIPIEINASVVNTSQGNRILSLCRDISERKRAAEALQQSHQELEAIYEGMFDGLLIVDVQSKQLLRANASICRMLGYSEPELLSMSVVDLHPVDEVPAVLERIRARVEGRLHGPAEARILKRDGSLAYADVVSNPLSYGGRPCIAAFFRDVTERKQSEEALRTSEERFRSYFEQGLLGMAVTSLDKQWVEVNQRLCEILGYSREEIIQMRWPEATFPDDLETSVAQFNRMLAGEIDQYTLDKRFLRKDGKLVYVALFVRCFRRKDGTPDHILALMEDVTERKQAQEALERERRTLEHLFRSSDHERQLIAYDIHDGLAQFLAGGIMQFETFVHLKEKKPKEAQEVFDAGMLMLRQSHAEARRLINGVRPPILDEAGIVTAISHLIHEQRESNGPQIEYHADVSFDRLVPIQENTIYRIVQEALTNALKYSQAKKIRVQVAQRGEDVWIEVQDWGIGFRQDEIGKQCFGLQGIRERTRLLGGKTAIETAPGRGTRVVVEMPLVARKKGE